MTEKSLQPLPGSALYLVEVEKSTAIAEFPERRESAALSDEEIVERVRAGEVDLFEILMRRHNQRLYRACRSVLDDGEAEEVAQEAWVRAFTHLEQFAGRARFSTWLLRIGIHEAWARARRARRFRSEARDSFRLEADMRRNADDERDPEKDALRGELGAALEAAVDSLPERYRSVFVLREIEDLDTAETAACLDITVETVKTRLHRARGLLQKALLARAGATSPAAFHFAGARCDRMVAAVLRRIKSAPPMLSSEPAPRETVH